MLRRTPRFALLAAMLFASCVASAGPAAAQAPPPKGAAVEPTNAQEAAEKKAAEDRVVNEKFQAWKASLPPEHQKWETVLEANLGGFYLPIYKREKVAGKVTAWDYVQDDATLPRVLLVGDSVSRGYTLAVREALAGKANVHRAPENCGPVANGLKKLDVWLGEGKWDVVHFNFGIHDSRTAPADYEKRLDEFTARLLKTGAKVIWASTTPVPPDTKDGPEATAAIEAKNAIAAKVMQARGAAVDDLFTFVTPHLAEVQNPKDVHFNAAGYKLLGGKVAEEILKVLPKPQ